MNFRKGKKTEFKDKKFGFGGRKKRSKYNTSESYAEAFKGAEKKGNGKGMRMGNGKGKGRGGGGGGRSAGNKNKPKKRLAPNKRNKKF